MRSLLDHWWLYLLIALFLGYVAVRAARNTNDGRGWLGPTHGSLSFLLAVDIVGLVLLPLTQGTFPIGSVDGTAFAGGPHPELFPEKVLVSLAGRPSVLQEALYLAGHGMLAGLVAIPILVLARRLIRRAIDADPFTPDMVRGLRRLGLLVLGGGGLAHLLSYVASVWLLDISLPATASQSWSEPDVGATAWWVLPGLLILAFAEIVHRGCALRAELDEVI
ncbi:DUF2975 domain-containing protein [Longispora sp. K20-0274]|uniref:DUF2975 domain-containing protein n=1 Tax=Longispora sp. K20-0274 TaxID=3088255 RepID=UPI00399C310E